MYKTKLLLLIFIVLAETLLLAKQLPIDTNGPKENAKKQLNIICEKAIKNSESNINGFYYNNLYCIENNYCLGTLNDKLTLFLCEPVINELNSLVTSDYYFEPSALEVDITDITWKTAEDWKKKVRNRFITKLNKIKGKYETCIKNIYSNKNTSIFIKPETEYKLTLKRFKIPEEHNENSIVDICESIREYIADTYRLNKASGCMSNSDIFSEESDFYINYPGNFEAASKECSYTVWNGKGKITVNCRKHGDFILESEGIK